MKLYIISKSKDAAKWVSALRKMNCEIVAPADAGKLAKTIPSGSFVYFDASAVSAQNLIKATAPFLKRTDVRVGIIDPKNAITDVTELFHKGAADYIGRNLIGKGITAKRIEAAIRFKSTESEDSSSAVTVAKGKNRGKGRFNPSGRDWKGIAKGKEYSFCMMFIELDATHEAKSSTFGSGQHNAAELFRKFVDSHIEGTNGKIWMWHNIGGLILFPFDGRNCDSMLPALRMMLNRNIFSIDESIFTSPISFRIALHIGNTEYKDRGDTGTIVSDSVNFIFHLGQKRADHGSFYATQEILDHIPHTLRDFFVSDGSFEERTVFHMSQLGK